MKRRFSHISTLFITLALVFVAGEVLLPQTATAQISCGPPGSGYILVGGECVPPGDAINQTREGLGSAGEDTGGILNKIFGLATDLMLSPLAWLSILVLQIAELIFSLSGILLNQVVLFTIVNMKESMNGEMINKAWGTIRDVANMGFIFILLYAAIKTILGIGSDVKKLIINVIIVAILINFSLFFTKVVIDASNVLAITFHDAIVPTALTSTDDLINDGLSSRIKAPLQLGTILDIKPDGITTGIGPLEGRKLIIVGSLGTIFVLIASFVFFAISIMFIIRFVVLMFVLILSPIAFMAFILPGLKKAGDQWREALIGQAFFAPVFFLLIWIVVNIIDGVLTTGGSFSEAFTGNESGGGVVIAPGSIMIIMNFVIIITLLITSLIIAKSWANKAGGAVVGMNKWALGRAGGTSFGLAGKLGRETLGRAGAIMSDSEKLKDRDKKGGIRGMTARLALAAGRKTAGAHFDVRGTGLGKQLGAGKAKSGGFTANLKKKVEAEKKFAHETLKPSDLLVMKAERALSDTKKGGGREKISQAQAKLDSIKGVGEDVLRQRKLKELRAGGMSKKGAKTELDKLEDLYLQEVGRLTADGQTQDQAKKSAENVGWHPKVQKGLLNTRKEAYAKRIEERSVKIPLTKIKIPFSFTGRNFVFGPVKKESKLAANAIRRSMKEKKPGEKIAQEIEKQVRKSGDVGASSTPSTPPPAPPTPTPTPPTDETSSTP